jgi:hypothetical protein
VGDDPVTLGKVAAGRGSSDEGDRPDRSSPRRPFADLATRPAHLAAVCQLQEMAATEIGELIPRTVSTRPGPLVTPAPASAIVSDVARISPDVAMLPTRDARWTAIPL